MSDIRHVALMLCTRGRADVRRASIGAIGRLEVPDGVRLTVVVGDNNPLDAKSEIAAELTAAGHPFRIVRESRRGYCFIRNSVLEAALEVGADLLIFIDDDHAVEPDLVARYLEVFAAFDADVVHGSYVGSTRRYREGQRARKVATYNVAFRRRLVADGASGGLGRRFDPRLNLLGREDVEFFRDAAALGARLVYSERARTRLIEGRDSDGASASVPLTAAYAEGRNATYVERLKRGWPAALAMFLKSYVRKGLSSSFARLRGKPKGAWDLETVRGAWDGLWRGGVERPAAKRGEIVEVSGRAPGGRT